MSRESMSSNGLRHFENTRAVLTKLSDNEELFGWVHPAPLGTLIIATDRNDVVFNGDPCRIRLNSNKASTTFDSTCCGVLDGKLHFKVPNLIRMEAPESQVRLRAPLMNATIKSGAETVTCPVVDIAAKGLGLVTNASYETGQQVKIVLDTPNGQVYVDGTVVYCRFDNDTQSFRTGINFLSLSRIDERRWAQLLTA